jgi:hypothetical protein
VTADFENLIAVGKTYDKLISIIETPQPEEVFTEELSAELHYI